MRWLCQSHPALCALHFPKDWSSHSSLYLGYHLALFSCSSLHPFLQHTPWHCHAYWYLFLAVEMMLLLFIDRTEVGGGRAGWRAAEVPDLDEKQWKPEARSKGGKETHSSHVSMFFLDCLPSLHQENHSFVPFLGLTALSLSIDPSNMQTSSLHLNLDEAFGRHYVFLLGLVEWLCSAPMHWLRCDIKI